MNKIPEFSKSRFNEAVKMAQEKSQKNFKVGQLVCHPDIPRICKFGGIDGEMAILCDKIGMDVKIIKKPYNETFSFADAVNITKNLATRDVFHAFDEQN